MNIETTAKKMSRNMKKQFPDIPLEDLESEAYVCLLESKEKTPAAQYVAGRWNLYHYASVYAVSMRECRGDDIEWINDLAPQDDSYKIVLGEDVIGMRIDASNELSSDGNFVLENILSGNLLKRRKTDKYNILSMQMIKDNLVLLGWNVYRTRVVVSELKFWWRAYGIA